MSNTLIVKGAILLLIVIVVPLCLIFLKNKRKEIMLIIISSAIALIVAEFALRFFFPQTTDYGHMIVCDSTLGWKFISNGKGAVAHRGTMPNVIETNALGFRDHAPSKEKKNKLMVVGDSFVANVAIEDKEVFTEIMEGKLEGYDVLNFGVSQYGQVQEYLLLDKWINVVDPNIVVVIVYLQNDFIENMAADGLFPRPFASLTGKDSLLTIHKSSDIKIERGFGNIFSKSHVNWLITRSINNLFAKADSSYRTEFYSCQSPIPREYRVAFKVMEELLIKINGVGREKNVPIVFALAPSILQVEDELWKLFVERNSFAKKKFVRSSPNDRLMQFGKANGLMMLDLLPVFLEEEKRKVKCYHAVEQHWTKEGNEVVAKALLNYLNANSLIK